MTRIHTLLGTCMTVLVTSAIPALAQGPTITSPTANQVFRAGPDYASDVLHDPWDFNNIEDVGQHPDDYLGWAQSANARVVGPSAFGVGSGKFIATNASNDPGIGLLYAGGAPNPGRSGQRYPVQTSLYQKLAFRMKATGAGGSPAQIRWSFGHYGSSALGAAQTSLGVTDGERVYQIDLVNNFIANSGATYTSQGGANGLRLDVINDPSPAAIELDWVRLTAPDSAQAAWMMNISASNCSGAVNVEVQDVQDASGLWASVATSLSFNYGILPPGNYRLRVTCNGNQSAAVPFTINDPPRITVLQPDERGGTDYATTVRGNPWDMDDAADVATAGNLDQGGFVASPQGGLMLRGRNVLSPNTSITGDPTVFWLYSEGASRPIASTRYRYLTFTAQLHHAFDLGLGSVARVVWASALNFGGAAAITDDILVWPGRNTYTIDLGALTVGNGLEACTGLCKLWAQASPRFLRFDPHEFSDRQVVFDLDNVTLAAPDEIVQGGTFPIQWSVSGVSAGTVNLYYDTDTNLANGKQLIVSGLSALSYNWPVGSLAPGSYYIYVEVNEPIPGGTDTRGAYSTGVLRVIAAANNPVVTLATHASGGGAYEPFNISGCAYNAATGGAADEVVVYAHPLQGQMGGVVQVLGYNAVGGLGTLTAAACASGPGYQVSNVFGLQPGLWTLRVLARNPVTGDFDEVQAQNVTVSMTAAPARNLRASVAGNTVTLAWDPPGQGSLTQYRIEAAGNPSFSGFASAVVPTSPTSITATLGNGLYYVRIVSGNAYTTEGPASNVINFTLPGGSPVAPPGAVTLSGQLTTNPVSLNWSQAGGGAATYALHAGTGPGQSNIAVIPLGGATSLPPTVVPTGMVIFARIVASNAAGSTTSNEVVVNVPVPGPPGGPPIQLDPVVSGNHVTLRWNAPFNSPTPTSYAIVARLPGSSAVIAVLPGVTSTSLPIPGVPSGSYVVTIVAMYGPTPSSESQSKTVHVQ